MKACLSAIAATFALSTQAAGLVLTWDPSESANATNAVAYRLYGTGRPYSPTNVVVSKMEYRYDVGTNLVAELEPLPPGQYAFAATAIIGGVESLPSNILLVESPAPPARLRTVVLQYGETLTNLTSSGFIRIKLTP